MSEIKTPEEKYGLHNQEPVIRTFTGKFVNVFDPKPEMFCIEDIAHALSNQCRFGGHLAKFYSVASHSILCSKRASTKKIALDALMHDASEAYLIDIPRPIKNKLSNYKDIEHELMKMLSKVFGFTYPLCDEVKVIDEWALSVEWNELVLGHEKYIIGDYKNIETEKLKFINLYKHFSKT